MRTLATDFERSPSHVGVAAPIFTLEEYFALERASERRFEYRDGEIVCMSGGSRNRIEISSNVHARLAALLSGRGCRAYTGDAALFVPAAPPYRYPDASVVCGEVRYRDVNGLAAIENPILVVEVLSPTSADFDRGTKFEWYKSIATFAEYLLVAQDRVHVTQRTRQHDAKWLEQVYDSLDQAVAIGGVVGINLPLRDVYEGVEL